MNRMRARLKSRLAILLAMIMVLSYIPETALMVNAQENVQIAVEDEKVVVEEIPAGDETPAPADETPAPADETPAPADGTPAPADETPAPADETPAPADETPAPADESGSEDITEDETVSPEEETIDEDLDSEDEAVDDEADSEDETVGEDIEDVKSESGDISFDDTTADFLQKDKSGNNVSYGVLDSYPMQYRLNNFFCSKFWNGSCDISISFYYKVGNTAEVWIDSETYTNIRDNSVDLSFMAETSTPGKQQISLILKYDLYDGEGLQKKVIGTTEVNFVKREWPQNVYYDSESQYIKGYVYIYDAYSSDPVHLSVSLKKGDGEQTVWKRDIYTRPCTYFINDIDIYNNESDLYSDALYIYNEPLNAYCFQKIEYSIPAWELGNGDYQVSITDVDNNRNITDTSDHGWTSCTVEGVTLKPVTKMKFTASGNTVSSSGENWHNSLRGVLAIEPVYWTNDVDIYAENRFVADVKNINNDKGVITFDIYGSNLGYGKTNIVMETESRTLKVPFYSGDFVIASEEEGVVSYDKEYDLGIITLKPGETKDLCVADQNQDELEDAVDKIGLPVYWYSEDTDIAEVDQDGKVTAKANGRTDIVARIGNNESYCLAESVYVADTKAEDMTMEWLLYDKNNPTDAISSSIADYYPLSFKVLNDDIDYCLSIEGWDVVLKIDNEIVDAINYGIGRISTESGNECFYSAIIQKDSAFAGSHTVEVILKKGAVERIVCDAKTVDFKYCANPYFAEYDEQTGIISGYFLTETYYNEKINLYKKGKDPRGDYDWYVWNEYKNNRTPSLMDSSPYLDLDPRELTSFQLDGLEMCSFSIPADKIDNFVTKYGTGTYVFEITNASGSYKTEFELTPPTKTEPVTDIKFTMSSNMISFNKETMSSNSLKTVNTRYATGTAYITPYNYKGDITFRLIDGEGNAIPESKATVSSNSHHGYVYATVTSNIHGLIRVVATSNNETEADCSEEANVYCGDFSMARETGADTYEKCALRDVIDIDISDPTNSSVKLTVVDQQPQGDVDVAELFYPLEWYSTKPSVAEVTPTTGSVTAKTIGTTTIYAKFAGSKDWQFATNVNVSLSDSEKTPAAATATYCLKAASNLTQNISYGVGQINPEESCWGDWYPVVFKISGVELDANQEDSTQPNWKVKFKLGNQPSSDEGVGGITYYTADNGDQYVSAYIAVGWEGIHSVTPVIYDSNNTGAEDIVCATAKVDFVQREYPQNVHYNSDTQSVDGYIYTLDENIAKKNIGIYVYDSDNNEVWHSVESCKKQTSYMCGKNYGVIFDEGIYSWINYDMMPYITGLRDGEWPHVLKYSIPSYIFSSYFSGRGNYSIEIKEVEESEDGVWNPVDGGTNFTDSRFNKFSVPTIEERPIEKIKLTMSSNMLSMNPEKGYTEMDVNLEVTPSKWTGMISYVNGDESALGLGQYVRTDDKIHYTVYPKKNHDVSYLSFSADNGNIELNKNVQDAECGFYIGNFAPAVVTEDGSISVLSENSVDIIYTDKNKASKKVDLTIVDETDDGPEDMCGVNDSEWISSDTNIATVDEYGVVTPVAEGQVTIYGRIKNTCESTEIVEYPISVEFNITKQAAKAEYLLKNLFDDETLISYGMDGTAGQYPVAFEITGLDIDPETAQMNWQPSITVDGEAVEAKFTPTIDKNGTEKHQYLSAFIKPGFSNEDVNTNKDNLNTWHSVELHLTDPAGQKADIDFGEYEIFFIARNYAHGVMSISGPVPEIKGYIYACDNEITSKDVKVELYSISGEQREVVWTHTYNFGNVPTYDFSQTTTRLDDSVGYKKYNITWVPEPYNADAMKCIKYSIPVWAVDGDYYLVKLTYNDGENEVKLSDDQYNYAYFPGGSKENPISSIVFNSLSSAIAVGETVEIPVVYTPATCAAYVDITYTTDKPDKISIEESSDKTKLVIKGLSSTSDAAAKVTATVKTTDGYALDMDFTCDISVYNNQEAFDLLSPIKADGAHLSAFVHTQKTLEDVAGLPAGWTWSIPKSELAYYATTETVEFPVQYTNMIGAVLRDTVPVDLYAVKGASLVTSLVDDSYKLVKEDGSSVPVYGDEKYLVRIDGSTSGVGDIEAKYPGKLKWVYTASDTSALTVTAGNGATLPTSSAVVKALKKGTYTVKAEIYCVDGNIKLAETSVKIVVTVAASKGILSSNGILLTVKQNDAVVDAVEDTYFVNKTATKLQIINDTPARNASDASTAYKFTYKSSDTSIIKIGTAEANAINLIPLKAGTAVITATSDDTYKTARTIVICVKDKDASTIKADNTALTFNTLLAPANRKQQIVVSNGFGGELVTAGAQAPAITAGSDIVSVVSASADGTIWLDATKAGSAKLKVYAYDAAEGVGGAVSNEIALTIKVTSTIPTITIKQIDNLNLTSMSKPATFSIGIAGANIESVTVDGLTSGSDYEYQDGLLTVRKVPAQGNALGINIKPDGYAEAIKKSVTLKTEEDKLALASSSGTFYYTDTENVSRRMAAGSSQGIGKKYKEFVNASVDVQLLNKSVNNIVDLTGATLTSSNSRYKAEVKGKYIRITNIAVESNPDNGYEPATTTETVTITVHNPKWGKDFAFDYKISFAKKEKLALKLDATTLTLYNYKDSAILNSVGTKFAFKGDCGGGEAIANNLVIAESGSTKSLNTTINVAYDAETGYITATKMNQNIKAGTYKYSLKLNGDEYKNVKAVTLTVKVVDSASEGKTAASVSVKSKGTIDVLNRDGTKATLTPAFKNLPKDAIVKNITVAGNDAAIFDMIEETGNVVSLRLKDGVKVKTKTVYNVALKYVLDIGGSEVTVTSADIKIKFTQKSGKAVTSGVKGFSAVKKQDGNISLVVNNSAKVAIPVERVELVSDTSCGFKLKAFDPATGTITVSHLLNGKTVSGKTYTLKFNVYAKDAGANEKPMVVSYKVKIVK